MKNSSNDIFFHFSAKRKQVEALEMVQETKFMPAADNISMTAATANNHTIMPAVSRPSLTKINMINSSMEKSVVDMSLHICNQLHERSESAVYQPSVTAVVSCCKGENATSVKYDNPQYQRRCSRCTDV